MTHDRIPITELGHKEARKFFLQNTSYIDAGLPAYFNFEPLLTKISSILEENALSRLTFHNPSKNSRKTHPEKYLRECDDVNYVLTYSKDGRYAWRSYELIHPALYVDLVHTLTESEESWKSLVAALQPAQNSKIECLSIPIKSSSQNSDKAEQIKAWWENVEQRAIALSLEYEHMFTTDIVDCYGSIYTHSIPWALHGKETAKKERNNQNYIGNRIDVRLQNLRQGQTNGIPQGSALMDFIAEIVLGYLDKRLACRLKKLANRPSDYKILRYRDDYRIFVNNPADGHKILKELTLAAQLLGFRIHPMKTVYCNDLIIGNIKKDKLAWNQSHAKPDYWLFQDAQNALFTENPFDNRTRFKTHYRTLQKSLLVIYEHSEKYPNSGSLCTALKEFYIRLKEEADRSPNKLQHPDTFIAIITAIAKTSPRAYPSCAAILSLLLQHVGSSEEKKEIITRVEQKLSYFPNTTQMNLWLQRVAVTNKVDFKPQDDSNALCHHVDGKHTLLWNIDWIQHKKLRELLKNPNIVSIETQKAMPPIIEKSEFDIFEYQYRR